MRFFVALMLVACVTIGSVFALFAQQQETSPQDRDLQDLAFPTWVAFEELEITVMLIIQTSPPEQRQRMLRILNATAASPQVPEDRRQRVAAIRERLAPLLERQ